VNSPWPQRTLRWTYVAFICAASGLAIQSALGGAGEGRHAPRIVLVLAVPELLAAAALLIRPAERVACAALLAIYAVAGIVSVTSGDLLAPLRFLYYAATAISVVTLRSAGADRLADG
jgi:hypothetical protein